MPGYFKLQISDWLRGAITAALAAAVVPILAVLQNTTDLLAVDWGTVLSLALNVAISAFIGDIARRLGTNKKDEVLGIKATKPKD